MRKIIAFTFVVALLSLICSCSGQISDPPSSGNEGEGNVTTIEDVKNYSISMDKFAVEKVVSAIYSQFSATMAEGNTRFDFNNNEYTIGDSTIKIDSGSIVYESDPSRLLSSGKIKVNDIIASVDGKNVSINYEAWTDIAETGISDINPVNVDVKVNGNPVDDINDDFIPVSLALNDSSINSQISGIINAIVTGEPLPSGLKIAESETIINLQMGIISITFTFDAWDSSIHKLSVEMKNGTYAIEIDGWAKFSYTPESGLQQDDLKPVVETPAVKDENASFDEDMVIAYSQAGYAAYSFVMLASPEDLQGYVKVSNDGMQIEFNGLPLTGLIDGAVLYGKGDAEEDISSYSVTLELQIKESNGDSKFLDFTFNGQDASSIAGSFSRLFIGDSKDNMQNYTYLKDASYKAMLRIYLGANQASTALKDVVDNHEDATGSFTGRFSNFSYTGKYSKNGNEYVLTDVKLWYYNTPDEPFANIIRLTATVGEGYDFILRELVFQEFGAALPVEMQYSKVLWSMYLKNMLKISN